MAKLELFGSASCPYTKELREWLIWSRREFEEYDIELNPEARARMDSLDRNLNTIPVLVEDGKVTQIGWRGRGCFVRSAPVSQSEPQ